MVRRGLTLPTPAEPRPPAPPLSFRQFVDRARPGFRWYSHSIALADVLQRVADGELKRVMVFMPPRHGKSETVSRLFSAYWLYRHPEQWVGLCSYGAELAYTLSRAARENFQRAGGQVKGDVAAVKHWETTAGGGMWAAGVGGPILGKGWHLGIIDDPNKNADEAHSETIQAGQREWYESTFYTREEPNPDSGSPDGALVIINQRWSDKDLSGWLLEQEDSEDDPESAEHWHIVCLEAIKEEQPESFPPTCTVEPDWRHPGEALCPERRPVEKLRRIARRIGDYFFSAIFQQRPRPRTGTLFQRGWFADMVDVAPARARRVRYWDKAGTEGGGAYSCGVLLAATPDNLFYIEDVVRGQWSAGTREATILQTAQRDGRAVEVWVEQEPGSGGKESAQATVRNLAGFLVHAEPVTGDKATRARPLAAQAEAGNVRLVRDAPGHRWNAAFVDELTAFPHGKFKDQVDAAGGAFNKLAGPARVASYGPSPTAGYRGTTNAPRRG